MTQWSKTHHDAINTFRKEILRRLWNQNFHHRAHKIPPRPQNTLELQLRVNQETKIPVQIQQKTKMCVFIHYTIK